MQGVAATATSDPNPPSAATGRQDKTEQRTIHRSDRGRLARSSVVAFGAFHDDVSGERNRGPRSKTGTRVRVRAAVRVVMHPIIEGALACSLRDLRKGYPNGGTHRIDG